MEQKILEALIEGKEKYRFNYFGIRTDNKTYSVGDRLNNSYNWADDAEEDEQLDGTSATGFGYLWYDEDDMDEVKKALETHKRIGYRGDHIYLIGGDDAEYGNDEDEIVIKRAAVVAVIK